jgi:acetyltransferase-like isoleucine patch superfamily enzyme
LTTGLIAIGKTPNTDVAFIKEIQIGNNVFVGMGAILLPGTIINNNVIIGSGSVVRGIIPENSIVIGNPWRVVSTVTEKAYKWEKTLAEIELRVDK